MWQLPSSKCMNANSYQTWKAKMTPHKSNSTRPRHSRVFYMDLSTECWMLECTKVPTSSTPNVRTVRQTIYRNFPQKLILNKKCVPHSKIFPSHSAFATRCVGCITQYIFKFFCIRLLNHSEDFLWNHQKEVFILPFFLFPQISQDDFLCCIKSSLQNTKTLPDSFCSHFGIPLNHYCSSTRFVDI